MQAAGPVWRARKIRLEFSTKGGSGNIAVPSKVRIAVNREMPA